MAKLSPNQLAAKWAAAMGRSEKAIQDGVDAVTVNPAEQAIAQKDTMLANYTDSVQSGRWENSMRKVRLPDWKAAMKEKGAKNAVAGAKMGQLKVERAEAEIAPIRDSIVNSLPPRGTIEQNLERAREMAMRMHEARRRA